MASGSKVPDYLEPLIGWRSWWVREVARPPTHELDDTSSLQRRLFGIGCGGEYRWEIDDNRAACREDARHKWPHPVIDCCNPCPGENHICGFNAYKKLQDVELFESFQIYGRVALWGRVIEHEHGYRAEYARILSLSDPNMALIYGVEVETEKVEVKPQEDCSITMLPPMTGNTLQWSIPTLLQTMQLFWNGSPFKYVNWPHIKPPSDIALLKPVLSKCLDLDAKVDLIWTPSPANELIKPVKL